ncbi:MAG: hypothetical protein AB8A39_00225 [Prochlorococcus sp.]|nr:hypothetical protein [Prochlorococcaceae cyanobacterium Fu_MAG_50]
MNPAVLNAIGYITLANWTQDRCPGVRAMGRSQLKASGNSKVWSRPWQRSAQPPLERAPM